MDVVVGSHSVVVSCVEDSGIVVEVDICSGVVVLVVSAIGSGVVVMLITVVVVGSDVEVEVVIVLVVGCCVVVVVVSTLGSVGS